MLLMKEHKTQIWQAKPFSDRCKLLRPICNGLRDKKLFDIFDRCIPGLSLPAADKHGMPATQFSAYWQLSYVSQWSRRESTSLTLIQRGHNVVRSVWYPSIDLSSTSGILDIFGRLFYYWPVYRKSSPVQISHKWTGEVEFWENALPETSALLLRLIEDLSALSRRIVDFKI